MSIAERTFGEIAGVPEGSQFNYRRELAAVGCFAHCRQVSQEVDTKTLTQSWSQEATRTMR